ncbi:MAG: hypothetical protein Q8K96_19540 [Rubrivivax sp.]|nr:hypothetical protein [Rubrivivax sp.]
MTQPQTPLSIPDCAPATLTLPDPLTLESINRLEAAIGSLLRTFRKDLRGNAADDPGCIEVDSWSIHLH